MVKCYYIKQSIKLKSSFSSSFNFSGHAITPQSITNIKLSFKQQPTHIIKMRFQAYFALLVIAVSVASAYATEESRQSSQSAAATGDRNKRGLYASPYLAPYGASPYVASPYGASPYVASPYAASPYVASPYVASPYAASPRYVSSPYVSSHHPYGAVSSYATYPYVSKTFASPYAYYP